METIMHYILEENGLVRPVEMSEWAKWFATHEKERKIAFTQIAKDICVSTVFVGIDMGEFCEGVNPYKPLVFETMVFGGKADGLIVRYATLEEARQDHKDIVANILAEISNKAASELTLATSMDKVNNLIGEINKSTNSVLDVDENTPKEPWYKRLFCSLWR